MKLWGSSLDDDNFLMPTVGVAYNLDLLFLNEKSLLPFLGVQYIFYIDYISHALLNLV